jgi:hypothetical protein
MMGEKLLSTHLKDQNQAKTISQALNTKFYNHGYSLNRKEASELGLEVHDKGKAFNDLLWALASDYIEEFGFNTPFNMDSFVEKEINKSIEIGKPNKTKASLQISAIESPRMLCRKVMNISIIYTVSKEMDIKKNVMVEKIDWETEVIKDE